MGDKTPSVPRSRRSRRHRPSDRLTATVPAQRADRRAEPFGEAQVLAVVDGDLDERRPVVVEGAASGSDRARRPIDGRKAASPNDWA